MPPRPPRSPLFPYTTLFRSADARSISRSHDAALPLPVTIKCLSRSEEHTSELQSLRHLVCRLLLEKKNTVVTDQFHVNSLILRRRQAERLPDKVPGRRAVQR